MFKLFTFLIKSNINYISQYNVRMTLDRRCILVGNENRVDVSIWRQFDVDLKLDFGYTT